MYPQRKNRAQGKIDGIETAREGMALNGIAERFNYEQKFISCLQNPVETIPRKWYTMITAKGNTRTKKERKKKCYSQYTQATAPIEIGGKQTRLKHQTKKQRKESHGKTSSKVIPMQSLEVRMQENQPEPNTQSDPLRRGNAAARSQARAEREERK